MVGGAYTHLDDMLASQYQLTDWAQHTTYQSSIRWGTFWLLVLCMRKLQTRPTSTWTAVSPSLGLINSTTEILGSNPTCVHSLVRLPKAC